MFGATTELRMLVTLIAGHTRNTLVELQSHTGNDERFLMKHCGCGAFTHSPTHYSLVRSFALALDCVAKLTHWVFYGLLSIHRQMEL